MHRKLIPGMRIDLLGDGTYYWKNMKKEDAFLEYNAITAYAWVYFFTPQGKRESNL